MANDEKDFFVSYTGVDRAWAEWIAWELEAAGFTTIIQAWDFGAGSNFVLEMQKGTATAERTVAVLSEAFLQSGFTAAEWAAAFAKDPTGEKRLLLPIRISECQPEGLLPQIVYIDFADLKVDEARERLLAAARHERGKPKTPPKFPAISTPSAAPAFPGALPPIFNVPHRNHNFTGREVLLATLREKLVAAGAAALTALHGTGGIGKTQIAAEYAYRHRGDYSAIWWVRSEEAAQLASDYAALGIVLGATNAEEPSQDAQIAVTRHWLEQNEQWLLVFDNVVKPTDLDRYTPRGGGGHMLITSRYQSWRAVADELSVEQWDRQESVDFLLKRTDRLDRRGANELAERLGDLPLALAQAGAYMEETGLSFSEYLGLFAHNRQELLKRGTAFAGYELTVATTWAASLERVESESPGSVALLRLSAFLAPDDIPIYSLCAHDAPLPKALTALALDPIQMADALAALGRYSLAALSGDALSLHRLVQAVIRDNMSEGEALVWLHTALQVLVNQLPINIQTNVMSWPAFARLLPHMLVATGLADQTNVAKEETLRIFNQAGLYLSSRAEFLQAKEVLERSLRICEEHYGPDHANTAVTLNNICRALAECGDLQGARIAIERALRIDEALPETDSTTLATRTNNLGEILLHLGETRGARTQLERAKGLAESISEPIPNLLSSILVNLGTVCCQEEDNDTARQYFEQALKVDESAFGLDHPEVAVDLINLGLVLVTLGDRSGARAAIGRALRICIEHFGENHPYTIDVQGHLESASAPT